MVLLSLQDHSSGSSVGSNRSHKSSRHKSRTNHRWRGILVAITVQVILFLGCLNPNQRSLQQSSTIVADLRQGLENLNIVAFGTSRTYGVGLGGARTAVAYPYALNANATNLAIRAAGPEYPALCTYTMLGETTMADVILIEFSVKTNDSLWRLARRLRQRFPDATIIFLHLWMPFQYYHEPKRENVKQTVDRALKRNKDTDTAANYVLNGTVADEWTFTIDQGATLEAIALEIGAQIYHQPRPDNPLEALKQYMHYFKNDMVHFSEAGHLSVARGIRDMIVASGIIYSNNSTSTTNAWQDKDACQSWYQTGELVPTHDTMTASDSVVTEVGIGLAMVKFGKTKHALEVAPPTAFLKFHNPLGRPVKVYLSYMMTAPQSDVYPAVLVSLTASSMTTADTTRIEPYDSKTNRYSVHVLKHVYIGTLWPHGDDTAMITITPKEENKKHPFRVTGIILTTKDESSPTTHEPSAESENIPNE